MELGEIIRQARKAKGLGIVDLARMVGVDYSTLSNWESGRRKVNPAALEKLQAILDIPGDVIGHALGHPQVLVVPLIGEVKAGSGGYSLDDWRWVYVDPRLYPGASFALQVWGDSMAPTLLDGDVAVCRGPGDPASGEIYVVGIEDHTTVKRIRRVNGDLYLVADNPEADWAPVKVRRGVRLVGRVIGVLRGLK